MWFFKSKEKKKEIVKPETVEEKKTETKKTNSSKSNSTKKEPSKKTTTKSAEAKTSAKTTTKSTTTKTANKKTTTKKSTTKNSTSKPKKELGAYRVVYDKEDRLWKIKRDGARRVIDSYATKDEALERVEELSESNNARVVVHKKDGKFQKQ